MTFPFPLLTIRPRTTDETVGQPEPPAAAFSADELAPAPEDVVTFTDESTGDPTSWLWDFGDGSTSTSQNPTHAYEEEGTYTVSLTVAMYGGSDVETKVDYIEVAEAPSYTGPLDLVPGAVVAYGVRALSAAWLGQNIFRLRRDSDDAEMNFAADAVTGDAPVANITTWLGAAAGFLVTWYDQSGNGLHLAANPDFAFDSDVGDGKCGFIGSDAVSASSFTATNAVTILMVGSELCLLSGDQNPTATYTDLRGGVAAKIDVFSEASENEAGGDYSGIVAGDAQHIYNVTVEFGDNSFRVDGVALAENNANDSGGALGEITAFPLLDASAGAIQEVFLYDGIKSAGNRNSLDQNASTYYGITLP